MKLLYCPVCSDVFRLTSEWRVCMCGRAGGGYNPDNETSTVGGIAKIFGLPNPVFNEAYMAPVEQIASLRAKYNNLWQTEMWWGEYAGDWQIIRVGNPSGPVPRDWYRRVDKLKKKGGVKGYDPELEDVKRRIWRTKALLRMRTRDFCIRLWSKYQGMWAE